MKDLITGILIDPTAKSVTMVEVGRYPEWKKLIECDLITSVTLSIDDEGVHETLWLDDEGLINEKSNGPFFKIGSYPQPLAGKGIIFSTDTEGETQSTRLKVSDIYDSVTWPDVKFKGIVHEEPVEGDVLGTTGIIFRQTAVFEDEINELANMEEQPADDDDETRRDI